MLLEPPVSHSVRSRHVKLRDADGEYPCRAPECCSQGSLSETNHIRAKCTCLLRTQVYSPSVFLNTAILRSSAPAARTFSNMPSELEQYHKAKPHGKYRYIRPHEQEAEAGLC
jgi:hypothetical protein